MVLGCIATERFRVVLTALYGIMGSHGSVIEMKHKTTSVFFLLPILLLMLLTGCSSGNAAAQGDGVLNSATLIYEETMSPNADYVTSEDDLVNLDIRIYQSDDFTVSVETSSNSPLIKDQQYSVPLNQQISKENISVTWTTMMGNPEPSEDDQLMVADI